MANPITLPIARLRALGVKVSTVIGHDPAIGDFIYSLRLPDSLGDLREQADHSGRDVLRLGWARAEVPVRSDGHHLVVKACAYRIGVKTDPADIESRRTDVARLLDLIADAIQEG